MELFNNKIFKFYLICVVFCLDTGVLWLISWLILRPQKIGTVSFGSVCVCVCVCVWGGLVIWVVCRLSRANYCTTHVLLAAFHAYLCRMGLFSSNVATNGQFVALFAALTKPDGSYWQRVSICFMFINSLSNLQTVGPVNTKIILYYM